LNFFLLGKILQKISMKKLIEKDRRFRNNLLKTEISYLVLKSIFKNVNYPSLVRWNAFLKLENLASKGNKIMLSNRCLKTVNKKRFNKLTNFSRHIFLKQIRSGQIHGMKKSSW
jgi:ribosomal protein S14